MEVVDVDLSNPIGSVIPTTQGAVLAVLARTTQPLSGREVAALTDGRAGQWRVNQVLGELTRSGIVLRESRPPAYLYRLNDEHLAAGAIKELASLRAQLIERIASTVEGWALAPAAVWLFGSAARGDGGPESDIDLVIVGGEVRRRQQRPEDETQIDALRDDVFRWTGNDCRPLYFTQGELHGWIERGERLIDELLREGIVVYGKAPRELLRVPRMRAPA